MCPFVFVAAMAVAAAGFEKHLCKVPVFMRTFSVLLYTMHLYTENTMVLLNEECVNVMLWKGVSVVNLDQCISAFSSTFPLFHVSEFTQR